MHAQWTTIPTSDSAEYPGYLSLPPTGNGPGIILIQEIWGVNEHIRAVADQLALAGYVVLAPDVFWRIAPRIELPYDEPGNAKAFEYYGKVDKAQAALDLADAIAHLRKHPALGGKVAAVGYCLGGQLAYRTAALGAADAAIAYYGGGIDQLLHLADKVTQPILFHHGVEDGHITPDKVAAIKLAFSGKSNATFFDYEGVGHAFNSWGRPVYNQRAAALAHGRSLIFLSEHL